LLSWAVSNFGLKADLYKGESLQGTLAVELGHGLTEGADVNHDLVKQKL
jgi:hypothetical protein